MRHPSKKIPGSVVFGLAVAVALDTVIQIAWKRAVSGIPESASIAATARGAVSNFYFYAAMVAFGAQLFNWTRVLARADLSFALPFTSLSYVTVLTLSSRLLHESISGFKMAGVGLILIGVTLISRTPYRTRDRELTEPAFDDK